MKIAVLAHIRHPIAEPFMGGMEAHCRMLCDGLRASGHDVTLFAAEGSHDPHLYPICDAPYEEVLPWENFRGTSELAAYQDTAFANAWDRVRAEGFDIVHNNSLYPAIMDWAARDGMACLTSQHVPPFRFMEEAAIRTATATNCMMTVTSHSQLALWDKRCTEAIRVVHNGVRTDDWVPSAQPGTDFVWVGRITPNKGTREAVEAARLAGVKLRLYGPIEDRTYFAREVEPLLGDNIEHHGHVELARLRPIVARARAALVTPRWAEPFGLVAAEALSCGTPVCAFAMGALPEVVGDCGFTVPEGDIEALAEAMLEIDEIDRAACRARALDHFSIEAMIRGYERCFEELATATSPSCSGGLAL